MGSQRVLSYKDRSGGLLAWACVQSAVIFLGGCGMNSESVPLTAEDAREALVTMVDASDGWVEDLRPDLDRDIVRIDENTVTIGRWHCNLGKRTFVGHRDSDMSSTEFVGSFTLNAKKQWEAVITDRIQAEWPLPGIGDAGGSGS